MGEKGNMATQGKSGDGRKVVGVFGLTRRDQKQKSERRRLEV